MSERDILLKQSLEEAKPLVEQTLIILVNGWSTAPWQKTLDTTCFSHNQFLYTMRK